MDGNELDGNELGEVKEASNYTYLGVTFRKKLRFIKHEDRKKRQTTKVVGPTQRMSSQVVDAARLQKCYGKRNT